MHSYVGPGALFELLSGALRLQPETYRGVCREPEATKLCIAVAVLAGAVSAPDVGPEMGLILPVALVWGIVVTLGILLVESVILWGLCRLVLRNDRTFGAVVRPLAAAHAPRLAYLLLPLIGPQPALQIAVSFWLLGAFVVAIEAVTARGWTVAVALTVLVWVLGGLLSSL